jgi:predicted ester cyclase
MSNVVTMSTEVNKASVRRFYDEVFNKKNRAAIDEFIAPNQVDHAAPPGTPGGLAGAKQLLGMYLTAFPDFHLTVEDMIAEGDRVVARFTMRGTQQGAFMDIPPTGKQVTVTAIDINCISGGKSVEHWIEMDTLGLLQQLGVIPAPGQAR